MALKHVIRWIWHGPEARSLTDPDSWLARAFASFGGGGYAASGISVTENSALGYPALWRGVNLISGDVGKLPLDVYRRGTNDTKDKAREHPAYPLVRRKANDYCTALDLKRTLIKDALLHGDGVAKIMRRGDGAPRALLRMPTGNNFELKVVNNRPVYYWPPYDNQPETILLPENVLHIRGLCADGYRGYSVISILKDSIGRGLAMQRFGARFFANGARLSGVLEHPGKLDPDAFEELRRSWQAMYGGVENTGKTAILEEGMKYNKTSVTNEEAQFVESEEFQIRQVSNILGIPPHKLGDSTRTSYNSLEQENQSYLDQALDPWLATFEDECFDKLLTEEEKTNETHLFEFNRNALVRADMQVRYQAYNVALTAGFMSRDEVRARENLNPLPNGEGQVFLQPLNMNPAGAKQPAGKMPAEDDMPMQQKSLPLGTIRAAHRTLLVDTLKRIGKRLAEAANRRVKKPETFDRWIDADLAADHRGPIAEMLAPVMLALAAIEPDAGSGEALADRLIGEFHTAMSETENEQIERTAQRWAAALPERLAGAILDKKETTPAGT